MQQNNSFMRILKCSICFICTLLLAFLPLGSRVSAATYEPAKAPKINYFTVSKTNIQAGETVKLKWDVINAKSIEIKGLEKAVEAVLPFQGEMEVWPTKTTTYTLTATGAGGTVNKTVTVTVGSIPSEKPTIEYFRTSATQIEPGKTVVLSWSVKNAKTVDIIGLEKKPEYIFAMTGSIEVFPTKSTDYILQATGSNGEVITSKVAVEVKQPGLPPVIKSFNASRTAIQKGESTTLSWSVENAKAVSIRNLQSGLAQQGSTTVTPVEDTTYILDVTGTNGETKSSSIKVTVNQPPKIQITNFTASETTVSKGSLVILSWNTTGATGCTLLTSDGAKLENRQPNSSIGVTPNATTTYTLVAYDANKNSVQKTITVYVK